MEKNVRSLQRGAPTHSCGSTTQRTWTLSAVFVLFILVMPSLYRSGAEGKSVRHEDDDASERTTRHRRSVRLCGSRLVDYLNNYCQKGIYEPRNCYITTRYYCSNPIVAARLPLCRISCGYTRTRRSGETRGLTAEEEALAERLLAMNDGTESTITRRSRHTRRRHIHSQCCAGQCTLEDFTNFCRAR